LTPLSPAGPKKGDLGAGALLEIMDVTEKDFNGKRKFQVRKKLGSRKTRKEGSNFASCGVERRH